MVADDEPDAEVFLELLDRGRQRRLRDVASFGGAREMLLARERDEVGQMPDQHERNLRGFSKLTREYTAPSGTDARINRVA